jgi:hypothetical protein
MASQPRPGGIVSSRKKRGKTEEKLRKTGKNWEKLGKTEEKLGKTGKN